MNPKEALQIVINLVNTIPLNMADNAKARQAGETLIAFVEGNMSTPSVVPRQMIGPRGPVPETPELADNVDEESA